MAVCEPVYTLEQLYSYTPPDWSKLVKPFQNRTTECVSGEDLQKDLNVDDWKSLDRIDRKKVRKTLVCHDMMGGYIEDKYVDGSSKDDSYTFYNWSAIDTFVYFSHHFVTIPPLGWINAAHLHGVNILGTIITESGDGSAIMTQVLQSEESAKKFADAIVNITKIFQLDGWLFNIECGVQSVTTLEWLVSYLTQSLHKLNPQSLVIWYDSVSTFGSVWYQNELNDKNKPFFDACDGIFLNYWWNDTQLQNSLNAAGDRALDVYAGIDVFGRGAIGGMSVNQRFESISKYGLSTALFAQGWDYETLSKEPEETFRQRFYARDYYFWNSFQKYLFNHGPTESFNTYFGTGLVPNHYNLNKQYLQTSKLPYGGDWVENKSVALTKDAGTVEREENPTVVVFGVSLKISVNTTEFHRLFICSIAVPNKLTVVVTSKPYDEMADNALIIALLLQEKNGVLRKLFLGENTSLDRKTDSITGSNSERIQNDSWVEKTYEVDTNGSILLEIGATLTKPGIYYLGGLAVTSS